MNQTANQPIPKFHKVVFSRRRVLIFVVIFATIGGYFIFRSFAAGVTTYGSFEGGNLSEYADASCGSGNTSIVTNPVREGKYAAFIQTNSNTKCYGDNNMVRVHLLGFPAGKGVNMNSGSTFWRAVSLRIPSTNTNNSDFTTVEVHQTSDTNCNGPAPFNLAAAGGRWKLVIRGSNDCSSSTFISHIFGAPNSTCDSSTRICHSFTGASDSIQTDQWYDFVLGWHMAPDNTGWFEAWMNGPGTNGKSVNIVPRTNAPTTYPAANYPMDSVYYNTNNSLTKVYYDGGAYSSDFNAITAWQNAFTQSWGSSVPAPTPPPSPATTPPPPTTSTQPAITQNIKAGQSLSGTVTWVATTTATNIAKVEFAMDANSSNTTDTTKPYERVIDTTKFANGGHNLGLTVTLTDGTVLWEPYQIGTVTFSNSTSITPPTAPPPVTPPPPTPLPATPSITQSISAGATLSGVVNWTATTSSTNIASVSFDMDYNQALSTVDTTAPYTRSLDTTKYANGSHVLGLSVTLTDGTVLWQPYQIGTVTFSNSTATSPPPAPPPPPTTTSDTTPPSTPADFKVTSATKSTVKLSWSASSDNIGVSSYTIYRNDQPLNPTTDLYFTDSGLGTNTAYSYYLKAKDAAGNYSTASQKICVSKFSFWSYFSGKRSWKYC